MSPTRRPPIVETASASGAGTPPRPASASPALSASQRRYLRAQCHHLKALIMLGNKGLSDSVLGELDRTLDHHELVKVRLSGADREERQQQIDAMLAATGAELVQQIGHVASLFRRNPEQPRLALPR